MGQFGGAAEPGRAGAEDGDAFAVLFRGGVEDVDVVVENVVGGVALEASDFDGIAFQIEDNARTFAKDLGRADAGATGAEDIGGEDGAGGAGRIFVGDFLMNDGMSMPVGQAMMQGASKQKRQRLASISASCGL